MAYKDTMDFNAACDSLSSWLARQTTVFTAAQVAGLMGVSLRTTYRYIAALRSHHRIDGGRGVGYLYRGPKK